MLLLNRTLDEAEDVGNNKRRLWHPWFGFASEICLRKISWDKPFPNEIVEKWTKWIENLREHPPLQLREVWWIATKRNSCFTDSQTPVTPRYVQLFSLPPNTGMGRRAKTLLFPSQESLLRTHQFHAWDMLQHSTHSCQVAQLCHKGNWPQHVCWDLCMGRQHQLTLLVGTHRQVVAVRY